MEYSEQRLADYREEDGSARGSIDVPFLLLTLLLLLIGVVMVLSASFARAYYSESTNHNATYFFSRQLFYALTGVAIMLFASRFPISLYRRFARLLLWFSLALLVLVLLGGTRVNGAKRWFGVGDSFSFQPSEITKIAVILYDAELICRNRDQMKTFRSGVLPFALVAGAVIFLLVLEPHLSASIIIILITAAMMFLGGTKLRWFALGAGAVGLGILLATSVLHYSSERISAWRDPFEDTSDTGYQIIQSLYAIGSGGLSGLGLGASRQKYLYLPEEHNDFIFSVVCEELGFIGAVLILVLFALLILRGFYLAMHCRDRYSFLVCAGITSLLAFQVILNVAVVTNLVPCTGISLPFFSYGGTALWLQLAEMGIILSISRDIPEKKFILRREKTPQNG